MEETVYHAKPVIGIPFFGDQYLNLKSVEYNGYGILVNFFEMTENSFENTVKEVLSNPKYAQAV